MKETEFKTVTLREVKSRWMWVQWMQDRVEGLTDEDLVNVAINITPFGRYLLDIQPQSSGTTQ